MNGIEYSLIKGTVISFWLAGTGNGFGVMYDAHGSNADSEVISFSVW